MVANAQRRATLATIEDGIVAVETTAGRVDPQAPTACANWTVRDLVRHVEAIAGAYLLWVGAAIGGRIGRMRTPQELEDYNDRMLRRLPDLPTDRHLHHFGELARDHCRLVRTGWSQPMMRTPDDALLRIGEHARIAALEWHLHAWDLGQTARARHRPSRASLEVLCAAWDEALTHLATRPRPADEDPWTFLLTASGRVPT